MIKPVIHVPVHVRQKFKISVASRKILQDIKTLKWPIRSLTAFDHCFSTVFPFYLTNLSEKGKWETVETCGTPPSPRTCHSMASVGSKFYVFGGGLSGPDPVPDTTVHVFNAGTICMT